MKGRQALALGVWTCGYLLVAGTLFLLSTMPDCPQGTEGAGCRTLAYQVQQGVALVLAIAYVLLTWVLFVRRR